MQSTSGSNRTLAAGFVSLLATVAFLPLVDGAPISKANNDADLNLPKSWAGDTVPGDDDIAQWDGAVTESFGSKLGDNLAWKGMLITNPGAAVYIGPMEGDPNSLTLGASGIDASTFSKPLYLRTPLALAADQTWKFKDTTSASLGVAGAVSTLNTAGFTLTIQNGSVHILDNVTGSGGLTHTGFGTMTISGDCTYTGPTTVDGTVQIGSGGTTGAISSDSIVTSTNGSILIFSRSDDFTFANTIAGDINLAKYHGGAVTLTGESSFTGSVAIYQGSLRVSSINSLKTNPLLGTEHSDTSNLGAPIINQNAFLSLGSEGDTGQLTYIGKGETTDRGLYLNGKTGGGIVDQSGTGLLKFIKNVTVAAVGAKALTLQGSTEGVGEIAGNIVDGSEAHKTSVVKAGTGTWVLSGSNAYTGGTTIHAGKLFVNGSIGGLVTVDGGTLGGSGSVREVNFTDLGGTLAPGESTDSTATLSTACINLTSTGKVVLDFSLKGTSEGTYDQINATGMINLGTTTTLNISLGFKPVVGKSFTIIKNGGSDAPTGTFSGLVEGTTFSVSGTQFKITYKGDGGRDVVLTVVP